MSTMTESPATTPIPVQLSEPEFIAFIFPYLSMPKRGPKCKLGYYRVFNLILWLLYTGMQWKCLPVPRAGDGTVVIHDTTIVRPHVRFHEDQSPRPSIPDLSSVALCSLSSSTLRAAPRCPAAMPDIGCAQRLAENWSGQRTAHSAEQGNIGVWR
jgi:hypothetical protein